MRRSFETRAYVQSTDSVVMAVLREAERLDEWLPDVTGSWVLSEDEGTMVVELRTPRLSSRRQLFEVRFAGSGVRWQQIGRLGTGALSGTVELQRSDDAQGTYVAVDVVMRSSLFSGPRIGRRKLLGVLAEALHALDLRAQRLARGAVSRRAAARRELLVLQRNEEGLELRFRGERFQLRKIASSEDTGG